MLDQIILYSNDFYLIFYTTPLVSIVYPSESYCEGVGQLVLDHIHMSLSSIHIQMGHIPGMMNINDEDQGLF